MRNFRDIWAEHEAKMKAKKPGIFDFASEANTTSAKMAFTDLAAFLHDDPARIKADITRRIKQTAEHGAELILNSMDGEAGYRNAYALCKLALNRSIGVFARHGVAELCSSEAYDEGLDYVIEILEDALEVTREREQRVPGP